MKVGDVVRLNSGGPLMTVTKVYMGDDAAINPSGDIYVDWFDGKAFISDAFPFDCLTLADAPPKDS